MIKIDWTLALQVANFLFLLFVLNTILYRPFLALLAKRREAIEGGHARARELKEQIDEKMARYQEQLQQARVKGSEERQALKNAAAKEEAGILAAAHEEANQRLQEIRGRVATEAARAGEELRRDAERLGAEAATKILGRAF